MNTIMLSLSQALAEGSIILPNIIFSSLKYGNLGIYEYILPFILIYSFEKAGVFAIQGFGKINNPYKILKIGLVLASIGSFINILPIKNNHILGAILIGSGLSIYSPLYKTTLDILNYKNKAIKGYIYLSILIGISMFYRKTNIQVLFIGFCLIIISVTIFIFNLKVTEDLEKNPMFLKQENSWAYFLPYIVVLLLTFFTRNLKQTSDTKNIIYMTLGFFIMLILDMLLKKKPYHLYSFETLWYGASRNFLIIYSLIYFISIGKISLVGKTYLSFALGMAGAFILKPKIKKIFENHNYNKVCIVLSQITMLSLIIPKLYIIGIFLSSLSITLGSQATLESYKKDSDFSIYERRVIRAKFYNLGAIIQQCFLFIFIIFCSYLIKSDGSYSLNSYIFYTANPSLEKIYYIVRILTIVLIEVTGLVLIKKQED